MSYRNPQQHVDTTTSQHFQNLQATIAGAYAGVAKSYADRQKELRAKQEKKDAETKLIKKGIAKEASLLQRTLYVTDNKYPEVDFGELYNPLIKEFEDLSLSIDMGTSETPSADKTRRDQIYASVTGITDTLTNLVSFTEDYDVKMDNLDKPGGIYGGGMEPDVNLGLNIMMQKLPGKRVPRFVDNDMSKFVWDIYDDKGNLVTSFSKQRLDQISKGIDEMVTVIPNNEKDLTAVQKANPNIFITNQDNKTGEMLPNGKINENFLGASKRVTYGKGDTRKSYFRNDKKVNKYDEGGIIWDLNFNASMNAEIAKTLGEGETDKTAIALHNTQFDQITYTIEDFINNPTFQGQYTADNLPEEIKTAIEDPDGIVFDFDEPLSDAEKAIFNVAYKKHFLDNKVPDYMKGEEEFEVPKGGPSEQMILLEQRRDLALDLQKINLPTFKNIDDSQDLLKEIQKYVKIDMTKESSLKDSQTKKVIGKSIVIGSGANQQTITSNMTTGQIKAAILRAKGVPQKLIASIDFSDEGGLLAVFNDELNKMAKKQTERDLTDWSTPK